MNPPTASNRVYHSSTEGTAKQEAPSRRGQRRCFTNQISRRERGVYNPGRRQKTVRVSTLLAPWPSISESFPSRREYDRTLGSPFHAPQGQPGQHPQATTSRPSQQPGFRHVWPNHHRNRTHDPMSSHPNATRYDYLYEHARAGGHTHPRSQSRTQTGSRADPFLHPFVQRATGHRRSEPGATSQESNTRPDFRQSGFQNAGSAHWTPSGGMARHPSAANSRSSEDEAAAESGVMRALGASGLVGVIMLVTAIMSNSKRTS